MHRKLPSSYFYGPALVAAMPLLAACGDSSDAPSTSNALDAGPTSQLDAARVDRVDASQANGQDPFIDANGAPPGADAEAPGIYEASNDAAEDASPSDAAIAADAVVPEETGADARRDSGDAGQKSVDAAAPDASTPTGSGPPMGFNNYNWTGEYVTASIIQGAATAMATNGMLAAGYIYVNMDDSWQGSRDSSGNLRPNSQNFPSGVKAVADFVHGKGFKFGIYTTPTAKSCGGYVGSLGHETQDINTFASWGVDYVKLDYCGADTSPSGGQAIAQKWRSAIQASGRAMALSINAGASTNVAPWASKIVTQWRTGNDICSSWYNKTSAPNSQCKDCNDRLYKNGIYDYLYSDIAANAPYIGPGHWGDTDMLEVGNAGLSYTEQVTHFSMWSMWSAPLLVGTNVGSLSSQTSTIILNSEIIAIDQDPKNVVATKIRDTKGLQVWTKPLAAAGVQAAALVNASDSMATITLNWSDLKWTSVTALRDLWAHTDITPSGSSYSANVPPHGVVVLRVSGQ